MIEVLLAEDNEEIQTLEFYRFTHLSMNSFLIWRSGSRGLDSATDVFENLIEIRDVHAITISNACAPGGRTLRLFCRFAILLHGSQWMACIRSCSTNGGSQSLEKNENMAADILGMPLKIDRLRRDAFQATVS
jgi:hypothetical protein